MDQEKTHLSILHLSDLHFGKLENNFIGANIDAHCLKYWKMHKLFDGLLGHSDASIRSLNSWYFHHGRNRKNLHVLISGDRTVCGRDTEFDLCDAFINNDLRAYGHRFGLRHSIHNSSWIPGNHDHWPGKRRIMGGPTSKFNNICPGYPMILKREPLNNKVNLVLVGINTDAEVKPNSIQRLLAIGRFQSQLNKVKNLLGPPKYSEVRILILHHSPGLTENRYHLFIDPPTKILLRKVVKYTGIKILLTGHTHHEMVYDIAVPYASSPTTVPEYCCGSSLVYDKPPRKWNATFRRYSSRFSPNTFYLHDINETDDGDIMWRARLYQRTNYGFTQVKNLPQQIAGRMDVKVWP